MNWGKQETFEIVKSAIIEKDERKYEKVYNIIREDVSHLKRIRALHSTYDDEYTDIIDFKKADPVRETVIEEISTDVIKELVRYAVNFEDKTAKERNAWLCGVAKYKVRDYYRRLEREKKHFETLPENEDGSVDLMDVLAAREVNPYEKIEYDAGPGSKCLNEYIKIICSYSRTSPPFTLAYLFNKLLVRNIVDKPPKKLEYEVLDKEKNIKILLTDYSQRGGNTKPKDVSEMLSGMKLGDIYKSMVRLIPHYYAKLKCDEKSFELLLARLNETDKNGVKFFEQKFDLKPKQIADVTPRINAYVMENLPKNDFRKIMSENEFGKIFPEYEAIEIVHEYEVMKNEQ